MSAKGVFVLFLFPSSEQDLCGQRSVTAVRTVNLPAARGLWGVDSPALDDGTDLRPGGDSGPWLSSRGLLSQVTTNWVAENSQSLVSHSSGGQTSKVKILARPQALGRALPASSASDGPAIPDVPTIAASLLTGRSPSLSVSPPKDTGHWI